MTVGRNVANLSLFYSLFYRYYFGSTTGITFGSTIPQLVPFPFSRGRSTLYCDRLHDFSVIIPKDVYVTQLDSGILCL